MCMHSFAFSISAAVSAALRPAPASRTSALGPPTADAAGRGVDLAVWQRPRCPFCGGPPELGVYVDSSALAKLYVTESESERLEQFLQGRRDAFVLATKFTQSATPEAGILESLLQAGLRIREGNIVQINRHKQISTQH